MRATCLDYPAAEDGAAFSQQEVNSATIEVHSTGVLYLCIPSFKASRYIKLYCSIPNYAKLLSTQFKIMIY